jgi:hypothetical protein
MELCSLHPFDEAAVHEFVSVLTDPGIRRHSNDWTARNDLAGRQALDQLLNAEDRGAYALSYALARELAFLRPSYAHPGISLTTWEARIDRGIGMLMRPPSRLLVDTGLDPGASRRLPIRLDMSRGMMGGAYIPARLIEDFHRLLNARVERTLGRLIEAGWDGVAVLGMMMQLADYAAANRLGIYEAMDVVTDDGAVPGIPGAEVVVADRRRLDKSLRTQLELAAKPPKKPGFFARLGGRGERQSDGSSGEH